MYIRSNTEARKEIIKLVDELIEKSNDTIPTVQQLVDIPFPALLRKGTEYCIIPMRDFGYYQYEPKTLDEIDGLYKKFVAELDNQIVTAKIHEIHNDNLLKIEINKKVIEKIKFIMSSVGIFETCYEYKVVRGSTKSFETKSGYIADMNRVIKISDNYDRVIREIDAKKRDVLNHVDKLKSDLRKKQREEAAIVLQKKKIELLAYLRSTYKLNYDASESEILSTIYASGDVDDPTSSTYTHYQQYINLLGEDND